MPDTNRLPGDDTLVVHFAHVAYRLAERFALRETGNRALPDLEPGRHP